MESPLSTTGGVWDGENCKQFQQVNRLIGFIHRELGRKKQEL